MLNRIKNNRIGFIVAAVVLVVMLIAGLIFVLNNSHVKLNKQLKLGNKYLSEANYDSAIASFDEAIAVDPMCVEAYLGLIEAYQGKGDDKTALEVAKKGFEVTKDERLNDWIKQLEEKTKKVEAETQEEDDFVDGVIVPISELFNCPTICGVPWREAGGIEGMLALMPPLVEQDVTNDEVFVYFASDDNYYDDMLFTYEIQKNGTQGVCIDNRIYVEEGDSFDGSYLGYYIEKQGDEKYQLTNSYTQGTPVCSYTDGFYNYMTNHGFTVDEMVENMGVDIDELKTTNKVKKYKSDMGEVKIASDPYGYIFDIRGEEDYGLWLEENENRIWFIIENKVSPIQ